MEKEEPCSFCDGTGQVVSSTTISGFKTCDCINIPQEEPKQETLEKILPKNSNGKYSRNEIEKAFELGAKWQQERMYSEEDMRKAYDQGIDDSFDIGFSSKDDTNFNVFIKQFKKK